MSEMEDMESAYTVKKSEKSPKVNIQKLKSSDIIMFSQSRCMNLCEFGEHLKCMDPIALDIKEVEDGYIKNELKLSLHLEMTESIYKALIKQQSQQRCCV